MIISAFNIYIVCVRNISFFLTLKRFFVYADERVMRRRPFYIHFAVLLQLRTETREDQAWCPYGRPAPGAIQCLPRRAAERCFPRRTCQFTYTWRTHTCATLTATAFTNRTTIIVRSVHIYSPLILVADPFLFILSTRRARDISVFISPYPTSSAVRALIPSRAIFRPRVITILVPSALHVVVGVVVVGLRQLTMIFITADIQETWFKYLRYILFFPFQDRC